MHSGTIGGPVRSGGAARKSNRFRPTSWRRWKIAEATPGFLIWRPRQIDSFETKLIKGDEPLMIVRAFKFNRYDPDALVDLTPPSCPFGLYLANANLSSGDIKAIGRMTHLEMLDLSGCKISDQDLVEIAKLTNLRLLNVSRTRVTEDGAPDLAKLRHLKALDLRGSTWATSACAT